jgi:MFS family permease
VFAADENLPLDPGPKVPADPGGRVSTLPAADGPGTGVRARSARFPAGFPRQYWLMISGSVISQAGGSMVWPFMLIYVSGQLHLPLTQVASLVTIQSVAAILSSFLAGTIVDRIGRRAAMTASLVGSGVCYLLLRGAGSFAEFAAVMAMLGLSNPLYQIGADAMVADMIPPDDRARAYSVSRIASNAGFGIGPAIGGLLAATSYDLAFIGASAGFLTYAALLALFGRETLGSARAGIASAVATLPSRGYGYVFRDRRYVVFVALTALGLTAPSMYWILLAVYTKTNFGLPEYQVGWLFMTNAAMCVFVQYFVTRATVRLPSLAVASGGILVYAVGVGSAAVMSSFPGFWISMVVVSLGELLLVPTAATYIARRAPADLRGRYVGTYWLAWACARGVAPILGGALNDGLGPRAIWFGALALGLASAAGLALLARRGS